MSSSRNWLDRLARAHWTRASAACCRAKLGSKVAGPLDAWAACRPAGPWCVLLRIPSSTLTCAQLRTEGKTERYTNTARTFIWKNGFNTRRNEITWALDTQAQGLADLTKSQPKLNYSSQKLRSTKTLQKLLFWIELQIQTESVRDLRSDHINVVHKVPSNNSLKEIPPEMVSNLTNENSSKIALKMQEKKNAQD